MKGWNFNQVKAENDKELKEFIGPMEDIVWDLYWKRHVAEERICEMEEQLGDIRKILRYADV